MFLLAEKICYGVGGIYSIVNMANGKTYYGSAINFKKRFNDHKRKLKTKKHFNQHLQSAFNLGQWLEFRVIEVVGNMFCLLETEQSYLDKFYDCQNMCYNMCPTAGSAFGRKHKEETKNKIGLGNRGKVRTEEMNQRQSEIKKTSEKCKKLWFKSGEENPMHGRTKEKHHVFGKKHSEESKLKMSLAQKGKPKHKLGVPVDQYDMQGRFIAKHISLTEAQRATGATGIRLCVLGRRKSSGGFKWKRSIQKDST
jgi:group I intron endonuclease